MEVLTIYLCIVHQWVLMLLKVHDEVLLSKKKRKVHCELLFSKREVHHEILVHIGENISFHPSKYY